MACDDIRTKPLDNDRPVVWWKAGWANPSNANNTSLVVLITKEDVGIDGGVRGVRARSVPVENKSSMGSHIWKMAALAQADRYRICFEKLCV